MGVSYLRLQICDLVRCEGPVIQEAELNAAGWSKDQHLSKVSRDGGSGAWVIVLSGRQYVGIAFFESGSLSPAFQLYSPPVIQPTTEVVEVASALLLTSPAEAGGSVPVNHTRWQLPSPSPTEIAAVVVDSQGEYQGIVHTRDLLVALAKELIMEQERRFQLEQEFDHLMAVINLISDGVVISDDQGIVLMANQAVERLTGLKLEDLVGGNLKQLTDTGVFLNEPASMIVRRQRSSINLIQEYYTGKKVLVSASPIFEPDGNIRRVVSCLRDITELVQLQEELERTKQITSRYHAELSELKLQQMQGKKIVAQSREMQNIIDLVVRVASVDSTTLILGESGVGKEVIAQLIYQLSPRSEQGAFIKVNCGAIPGDLLESELFGYESGAFTGAKKEGKPGMFELANGGILFLDEVTELPLQLQVKLLRVLQESEFYRVGSVKPTKVDVRILAATNKDLNEAVKAGKFREDLYYRLNVVPITVPPLRRRREDIVPLALHFLNFFNDKYHQSKYFSSEVLKLMLRYPWPGNVRELANLIERLVVTCESEMIKAQDLPAEIRLPADFGEKVQISEDVSLPEALEQVERELVERALRRYGSTYKAAKALGVSQSTVARCAKKYSLTGA